MKIGITGSEGFIGSHLVRVLREQNCHELVPIDSLLGDDVRKQSTCAKLKDSDIVVHLAALLQGSFEELISTNFSGTRCVVQNVKLGARLIYASSAAVYHGRGDYAISKISGEAVARNAGYPGDRDSVSLRIFNAYGPGQSDKDGAVVPSFVNSLKTNQPVMVHGDGLQLRDFIYVGDVVKAILAAIEYKEQFRGMSIDVGTGWGTKVFSVYQILQDISHRYVNACFAPARLPNIRRSRANIEMLRLMLGVEPRRLKEGLRSTWQWYTDNGQS